MRTKTQRNYNVWIAWNTIKRMGLDLKMIDVGNVYLKLKEYDSNNPPLNKFV